MLLTISMLKKDCVSRCTYFELDKVMKVARRISYDPHVGKHVPLDGKESTNPETEKINRESIYDRFGRLYL